MGVNRDQAQLWALRALWLLAPAVGGPLLDALDQVDTPGRWLMEGGLWLGWFVAMVAVLTPHPVTLTIVRLLSPSVTGLAVLLGLTTGWTVGLSVVAGYGLLLTAVALLPTVGDLMVNGSAYGSERRMALRTPAVAYLGPIPLAWLVFFIGLTGWAVIFTASHPVAGIVAAVVGAIAVWLSARLLYQLARRWIVFVPAGFVVHDPFQLAEPVLLPRSSISRLGPAEVDVDVDVEVEVDVDVDVDATSGTGSEDHPERLDLSAGSLGLALEVETHEPMSFGVLRNRNIEVTNSSKVVFSPSLPGALLSEARIRGITIKGSSTVDR